MELGERIRDLRLSVGLTQEELADRCELTKGYISQLENDLTSPSIATLVDILSALGTSLKEFFATMDETERVIFTKEDFIEKVGDGWSLKWLVPNAQKNAMEPVLVEIEPNSSTEEDFPHEGEEFGLVLSGEVEIILGNKRYKCKKGQSFYITPSKTHYIKNNKNTKATIVWVSSPPNF